MSDNTDFGTFGRFAETAVSEMPEEMRQAYDYTLKLPGPDKIWLANPRLSPTIDARCEALFASGLQRSDAPTAEMVAMPSKALCGGSASMAASAGWLKSSATTRRGRRAHALDPSVRRRGARRAADGGSCWPRQQQRRNREQSGEHSLRCRGRATTGSTLLQAYEIPVRTARLSASRPRLADTSRMIIRRREARERLVMPLLGCFCWRLVGRSRRGGRSARFGCWWPRSRAGSSGCCRVLLPE